MKKMNIEELKKRLFDLNSELKELLEVTGYAEYSALEYIEMKDDANDRFLRREFTGIFDSLEKASNDISYLEKEIIGEYKLRKNSRGRYETDIREFSCGSTIEFLYYDDFSECERWVVSSVEHDGNDYYITGSRYKSVVLEGLTVRIRRY